jgi:hypothetical protein
MILKVYRARVFYKILIIGIMTFVYFLVLNKSASAAVVLSPDPGTIPVDMRNYLVNSDRRQDSPSLNAWLSRRGFPAQQSISVPYGTTAVNLTYHSIGTVGFRPSSTTRTRYYVESATSGTTGVVGNYNEVVFAPNQNRVGMTAQDSIDFRFAPAGGFPVSGAYKVTLNVKIINEFSNGNFFRCVANGATASSLLDYDACPLTTREFTIFVNVPPPPVPGCTDSAAVNYNPRATVDDGSCIYDVCNNLPGNQATVPPGYSSNGSGGCVYPAPACAGNQNISVAAGLSFTAKKSFKNNNSIALPFTRVTYVIGSIVATTNASPVSGSIASGATREFSAQPHTITSPGTYTITWTLTYAFGTQVCSEDIQVTIVEPTCDVGVFRVGTAEQFVPRITVRNDNYVAVTIPSASYTTTPAAISGTAQNLSPVAGRGNGTFEAPATSIPSAGAYTINWIVSWQIGARSGNITCQNTNNLVSNQPYVRFYGNDVFAGGGFGDSCSSNGFIDAKGFGKNATHATYVGTASELAVFAVGLIQNVLPGSQRDRSSVRELAFANVDSTGVQVDPATGKFGGGFGSTLCATDYFAQEAQATHLNDTVVDLSTLDSGAYSFGSGSGSTISLNTGAGLNDGKRIVIYVDGNVEVTSNNTGRFGFLNAQGIWQSISDIPSISIIVSGNIYVQSNVSTMDGTYVAQPRFSNDTATGKIYTCADGVNDPLANLTDTSAQGNAAFILSKCGSKLTVTGAFLAQRVHLLRSVGTVNSGKPFESYKDSSNQMAEIFRFAPELLITQGGGLPPRSTNIKIDSIVALPPSF